MQELDMDLAREHMITNQIRAWDVLDPRVLDVLAELHREDFVPERYRNLAFADIEAPIGHGQTMMAPKIEAHLLQALEVEPGESVLEVGTGTGFVTAALAHMGGKVTSVDIIPEFLEPARVRLHKLGFTDVVLEARDSANLNWTGQRYDVIAVTGSLPVLEPSFADKLNIGGRLFVVVGEGPVMEALLLTRVGENEWARESLFETQLTPLINAYRPESFEF